MASFDIVKKLKLPNSYNLQLQFMEALSNSSLFCDILPSLLHVYDVGTKNY